MIKKVTVIGSGIMGRSIALAVAMAGYEVSLRSRRGRAGYEEFIDFLKREIKKGRVELDEFSISSRISWAKELNKAIYRSDVVIESIIESEVEKIKLFAKLDEICPKQVVLASNTSSLSISELSKVTSRPERVIGLHFFNPAHIMKLVEVVPTERTCKKIIQGMLIFVKSLGKIPILAKDSPGFIVNRILFPMINQAIFCLMEGIADAKMIDDALRLGINLPMGPLALADYIGLDTCLMVLENMYKRTKNSAYSPCPLLRDLVASGYLGRKTGKGFFEYQKTID